MRIGNWQFHRALDHELMFAAGKGAVPTRGFGGVLLNLVVILVLAAYSCSVYLSNELLNSMELSMNGQSLPRN